MSLGSGDGCFVCGRENPHGLRLAFEVDRAADAILCRWRPDPRYRGYDGILHGGIVATLLDEAVAKLCAETGTPAVTAELSVRYLRPVPLDGTLTVRGRIVERGKRLIAGESELVLEDGSVAAKAEVRCLRAP